MVTFKQVALVTVASLAFATASAGQADSTSTEANAFTNGKGNIFEMHPSGIFNFAVGQRGNSMLTLNNNSILRNAVGVHVQVRDGRSQDIAELSFERSPKYDMTFASLTIGGGALGRSFNAFRALTVDKQNVRFSISPRAGLFIQQKPDVENPDENVKTWGPLVRVDADLTFFPFKGQRNFGINANLGATAMAGSDVNMESNGVLQTTAAVGFTWRIR